jgi:hypothetical protein
VAKKSKDFVKGASTSIKKSIQEVEDFLAGHSLGPPKGPLRTKLHEMLGALAQKSFERGFRRGCLEMEKGFPSSVAYEAERALFGGSKRSVAITWKSKKQN